MTTVSREAHLPALDEHHRTEVGHELQATLVEVRPPFAHPASGRRYRVLGVVRFDEEDRVRRVATGRSGIRGCAGSGFYTASSA